MKRCAWDAIGRVWQKAPGSPIVGEVPSQDDGDLEDSPPAATSDRRGPVQVCSRTCSSKSQALRYFHAVAHISGQA